MKNILLLMVAISIILTGCQTLHDVLTVAAGIGGIAVLGGYATSVLPEVVHIWDVADMIIQSPKIIGGIAKPHLTQT